MSNISTDYLDNNNSTDSKASMSVNTFILNTIARLSPEPNSDGWNDSDVTIIIKARDIDGSGVKEIHYILDGDDEVIIPDSTATINITTEGSFNLSYWAVDMLDNVEEEQTKEIKIDKTAPITDYIIDPEPASNGWNNSNVTITLSATDTNGSGVKEIHYILGQDDEVTIPDSTATINITTDGVFYLLYWAVDKADNIEGRQLREIKLDKTAPTTIFSIAPSQGLERWFGGNLTVTLHATDNDGGSGIKEIHYILDDPEFIIEDDTANFDITTEGITTLVYWAVDNTDNIEDSQTKEIKFNRTHP